MKPQIKDEEYSNKLLAEHRYFNLNEKPIYSTGICGNTTVGYGDIDCCGYFEQPLNFNEDAFKIVRWDI